MSIDVMRNTVTEIFAPIEAIGESWVQNLYKCLFLQILSLDFDRYFSDAL